jgi:mRNA-degrading endonuclease RelE of RelBE toxin-antitoxin system
MPGRFRLRIDDWRVIYAVDDHDRTVLVLAVRRKSGPETYEGIDA